MSVSPSRFGQRIVVRQALVGLLAFVVVTIFAPRLLGLEWEVALGVFSAGAPLALVALVASMVMTLQVLRLHAPIVRAIALGARDIRPADIARLARLPGVLAIRIFALCALVSALILVPGIRPEKLDDGRAVSLLILAFTIMGAASIPNYVFMREATVELIELAPLEPITTLVETLELQQVSSRLTRWILIAVVVPVALMGAGSVLVAHAHLRTVAEQNRRTTAMLLARAALEPARGPRSEAGRTDAIEAAAEFGYVARIDPATPYTGDPPEPSSVRESDGQIAATVPLEDGKAVIRFSADLSTEAATTGVVVGVLAVVIAGFFANLFGRSLAEDLMQGTRDVRVLGTDAVLRGGTRVAKPARFAVVESLGRAIDDLAERFRVFAEAQERALETRAAAQRLRGLLFAATSHDLKSPLNAILGFADLVGREALTPSQRESLELISRSGRELLGLIETILDAARVEAGQLVLQSSPVDPPSLVAAAVRKAREIGGLPDVPIAVEISDDLPTISVDLMYTTRALAVIIAHALRASAADPGSRMARIGASVGTNPEPSVRIDIEYGTRDVSLEELERLFARLATARARGLTLGLSLSRSVIELQGGSVELDGAKDEAPVCRIWLPLVPPRRRPKLTAFPTLG